MGRPWRIALGPDGAFKGTSGDVKAGGGMLPPVSLRDGAAKPREDSGLTPVSAADMPSTLCDTTASPFAVMPFDAACDGFPAP